MNETEKIAILTFAYSDNSGSVLQAFALKTTIENLTGSVVETINYQKPGGLSPKLGKNVFCKPIKKWNRKKIRYWIRKIFLFRYWIGKSWKFQKEHLNYNSLTPLKRDQLAKVSADYGKIVVGSDQVWNYRSNQVDETFFLDFVDEDRKKVSYAASFGGSTINDEFVEKYGPLLKRFFAASVRELSGQALFRKATGKDAELVLDPSLLFTGSDWEQYIVRPTEERFIVIYTLENNRELFQLAEDYAAQHSCSIVKLYRSRRVDPKGKEIGVVSPGEWMGFIKYADAVFTNSFHGVCFSINFHKQFWTYLRNNENNARITSLLQIVDLKDRIVSDSNESGSDIDYEKVDLILREKREESIRYLKRALEVE